MQACHVIGRKLDLSCSSRPQAWINGRSWLIRRWRWWQKHVRIINDLVCGLTVPFGSVSVAIRSIYCWRTNAINLFGATTFIPAFNHCRRFKSDRISLNLSILAAFVSVLRDESTFLLSCGQILIEMFHYPTKWKTLTKFILKCSQNNLELIMLNLRFTYIIHGITN